MNTITEPNQNIMKKLLTVLFIFLTIISCKKDDEVLQEETGILENYVLLNFKIPESITNSNIEIIADGSNYETTDDGNYYVPKNSKVVYAVNKATDKIIYFTYPTSFNVSGRNSVSKSYVPCCFSSLI